MTPGETVLTMLTGAALATLGGVLAQFLTYRLQSRTWRRDLLKQRLEEVWRCVAAALEFADWVCEVHRKADGRVATSDYEAWHRSLVLLEDRTKELPVFGTAALITAGDSQLSALLTNFMVPINSLTGHAHTLTKEHRFPEEALADREAAKKAAEKVFARIEDLLDKTG